MLFRHVHWFSEGKDGRGDIRVQRGSIVELGKGLAPGKRERVLDCSELLALPGLINAHDHLDFNLLPIPGHPPYLNFTAYATDIYQPERSPLREMLRVSRQDRLLWGGYKNLASGVTTVCHHNPPDRILGKNFPVRVAADVSWSHSLHYSADPAGDYCRAGGRTFVIHAAEGVDESARGEIEELDRLGILRPNTVIVHGVALEESEIETLQEAGVGLIWCPVSNLSLFGRTAPVDQLRGRLSVALASDSLLTGSPTLLEELRAARSTGLATAEELLEMVTIAAAELLRLPPGAGTLRCGGAADVVVLPDSGTTPAETLMQSSPRDLQLVVVGGDVRFAGTRWECFRPNAVVDGRQKHVFGNLGRLKRRISRRIGDTAPEITASPLWSLLG